MSTAPAPAPKDSAASALATSEPASFNPHDFPPELIEAQRTVAGLYATLHALQARLPWSRETHPGWPNEEERGRERPGRPASPGWDPADAEQYDGLWEALRQATAAVQRHPWWERCRREGIIGPAMVAARQALKRAEGAVPLRQEDVEQTA